MPLEDVIAPESAKRRENEGTATLENGVPDVVEIILNRERAELLLLSRVENAKSEILVAISSFSFLSHLANIGFVDKMKYAKSNGARIMMICPNFPDDYNTNSSSDNDEYDNKNEETRKLIADIRKHAEVQGISGTIKGSVFVFDGNEILTMGRDEKWIGGFGLFSNNLSLIINYSSLFESFWNEKEVLHSVMRTKMDLMESNALLMAANERLAANDKLQKEFINIAAHELRTPVQPILGVLDLYDINPSLKAEAKEEDEVMVKKAHLRMVGRNASRLARLSSEILDATRIESNTLKLDIDNNINLKGIVTYALEDARKQGVNGNIEFVVDLPEEKVAVSVDSDRIQQVFANLINNAIKFTDKGTISIRVEKVNCDDRSQARVSISDTGKGIDSEIMPRLFQKFATKTDAGNGTGLGLFISKGIVEAHGGRIGAENNSNGPGAAFFFTLPM